VYQPAGESRFRPIRTSADGTREDTSPPAKDDGRVALAVCLLFDARSDLRVRDLWSRLEDAGISTLATHTHRRHHPHLSYAVLRSWDLAGVHDALAAMPPADPFSVTVHGTISFPRGRAALAPAITPDLGLRQAATVTAVEDAGAELHRHYVAGQWVPHISVATRAHGAELSTVIRMISDTVPLTLRIDSAALVDSTTGQTWPLPHLI
jgi:hypothetical protein